MEFISVANTDKELEWDPLAEKTELQADVSNMIQYIKKIIYLCFIKLVMLITFRKFCYSNVL